MRFLLVLALAIPMYADHACSAMTAGSNFGSGSLGGFKPFPTSSIYTNISAAPADPSSATWVSHISSGATVTPEYWPYMWAWWDDVNPYMNMPWYVVDGTTSRRQNIYIDNEPSLGDSDPGVTATPLPAVLANPRVQGSMSGKLSRSTVFGEPPTLAFVSGGYAYPPRIASGNIAGDKHYYIIDKSNCLLHELFLCYASGGNTHCAIATTFDMLAGDHQRPYFMASGSASGIPLFSMLGFAGEMASGASAGHALACSATVDLYQGAGVPGRTGINRKAFTGAASHHQYGNTNDPNLPPLGAILRLKASFDTSAYSGVGKGILETLKSHGCVLTDGGRSIEFYLELANGWGQNMLSYLDHPITVNSTNFDFVQVGAIYGDGVGTVPPFSAAPTISSFTASPSGTVAGGTAVTLRWGVGGATAIRYVFPEVGPLRGPAEPGMAASGYDTTGVVVHPQRTTTYTLMVQNGGVHDNGAGWPAGNRVTATVCVAVSGSTACP